MKKCAKGFLRIAFFIERPTKLTREWFNGTMLYTRHNPKWFVRLFELGNGATESRLDFGTIRPDGIIACGVPARFLQRFFRKRGMGDVPIMAFPQNPYPGVGTVCFDCREVAARAIDLFKRRNCRHVVYVGTHLRNGIRLSRTLAQAFADEAGRAGLSCSIPVRKVYSSIGIRFSECDEIMRQLAAYPKPCGILAYDDGIGRDILDLCRLSDITAPGDVYVLGMDDNGLVCEHAHPSLSSIAFDYERTAFQAAKALDDMIGGRCGELPQLVCGVTGITERASTQDTKSAGPLVARAIEYIQANACRPGGIDQRDIAKHLGVALRTLQLRFEESSLAGTILEEIQCVQFAKVCELLTKTKKPIAEIVRLTGFRTHSSLKAAFRKKFGVSMAAYRKAQRASPSA